MYEHMTFDHIMARCLSRVPAGLDKREGSVIYDAIAPAAAEMAQLYIELDTVIDRAFPDTATGQDLRKKALERSVEWQAATHAIRKGAFAGPQGDAFDLPAGSRFSGGEINYTVQERIAPGQYRMKAETAGVIGNQYYGSLIPITFIDGLVTAQLADVLIPGEDDETDEHLRARYYDSLDSQAFGGNIADYKLRVERLPGVGAARVVPVWNGGGTVKVIVISSEWAVPSAELVQSVQIAVDPVGFQGQGVGFAPIGHVVTVEAVAGAMVNVALNATLEAGQTWANVKPGVIAAIQSYFIELAQTWDDADGLVVRISQIETRVLNVGGILDVADTKLNGQASNLALADNQIPILGDVTNEAS